MKLLAAGTLSTRGDPNSIGALLAEPSHLHYLAGGASPEQFIPREREARGFGGSFRPPPGIAWDNLLESSVLPRACLGGASLV
eukprot:353222-Chlamydomonas_euryale.AAC.17